MVPSITTPEEVGLIPPTFQERAEWMNSIMKQLWPNVGHYTRKIIAESVEPAVKSALEGYGLSGFREHAHFSSLELF